MGEYAPRALRWLGEQVVAALGGEVAGIVGDPAHRYGYHRCRNALPKTDYSVLLREDKLGDGFAASGLDLKLTPEMMKVVTRRLLDSARDLNDPRLDAMREFYGTLDGETVTGYDCVFQVDATSDTSHLWHIHLSILREFSDSMPAMEKILAVIVGDLLPPVEGDEEMFGIPPATIPENGTGSYTIQPVNRGAAGYGPAWLNVCNDTFNDGYALRVYLSTGDGNFRPLAERKVLKSGERWSEPLPDGTACLSIGRVGIKEGATPYGGHLTFCVEYGKRAS